MNRVELKFYPGIIAQIFKKMFVILEVRFHYEAKGASVKVAVLSFFLAQPHKNQL